jgi:hypothetical protein
MLRDMLKKAGENSKVIKTESVKAAPKLPSGVSPFCFYYFDEQLSKAEEDGNKKAYIQIYESKTKGINLIYEKKIDEHQYKAMVQALADSSEK